MNNIKSEIILSVVIPNYNYGKYLKRAVDSALATNREDIEVLVADNDSSDNSREILKSYKDERLKVFEHTKNIGLYPNWNFLLKQAKGEYFKLLQSDDWLEPNFYDIFFSSINRFPDSDYLIFGFNGYVGDRSIPAFSRLPEEKGMRDPFAVKASSDLAIRSLSFSMPTLNAVRRSLILKGGGYHPEDHMRSDTIAIANAISVDGDRVITPVNQLCVATYSHSANDRRNYVGFEAYRDEVIFLRSLSKVEFSDGKRILDESINAAKARCTIYLFTDLRKPKGRKLFLRFLRDIFEYKLLTLNPICLFKALLAILGKSRLSSK